MSLVTLQEAANRLSISRATLYRWSREGRIRLVQLGPRATRVREEELRRLETAATPLHDAPADRALWKASREADLAWAMDEVEAEAPVADLATWLKAVGTMGVPIRWNSQTQEFQEDFR